MKYEGEVYIVGRHMFDRLSQAKAMKTRYSQPFHGNYTEKILYERKVKTNG